MLLHKAVANIKPVLQVCGGGFNKVEQGTTLASMTQSGTPTPSDTPDQLGAVKQ
jgi:hypothetical protein